MLDALKHCKRLETVKCKSVEKAVGVVSSATGESRGDIAYFVNFEFRISNLGTGKVKYPEVAKITVNVRNS